MSDKSNIQHLRDILKKIQDDKVGEAARNDLFEEVEELIDAIGEDTEEIKELKEKLETAEHDLAEALDEEPSWNTEHLGLDKFYWKPHNENLQLTQEVESFVSRLRKKYIGVTAWD